MDSGPAWSLKEQSWPLSKRADWDHVPTLTIVTCLLTCLYFKTQGRFPILWNPAPPGNIRCFHSMTAVKWWRFQWEELLVLEVKTSSSFENWPFLLLKIWPSFLLMISDQLYAAINLSKLSFYCIFVRELPRPSLQRSDIFRMLVLLSFSGEIFDQIDFLCFVRPAVRTDLHKSAVTWKLEFIFNLVGFCLTHSILPAHKIFAQYKMFF